MSSIRDKGRVGPGGTGERPLARHIPMLLMHEGAYVRQVNAEGTGAHADETMVNGNGMAGPVLNPSCPSGSTPFHGTVAV